MISMFKKVFFMVSAMLFFVHTASGMETFTKTVVDGIVTPVKESVKSSLEEMARQALQTIKSWIIDGTISGIAFTADLIRDFFNGILNIIGNYCGGPVAQNIALILIFAGIVVIILDYFFGLFGGPKEKPHREVED